MSFLSPLMLFGAAAISIPIAIHFFFRSRYRTVPWAAMKFLLTSIEQTSRRLKFQELLLLAVRCLLLALLALALARPISALFSRGGQADAVDAVFVFDVSYSMTAKEGGQIRLEKAKAAAIEIIDQLPPYSTVRVIACTDRANYLGPRTPGNLDQAKYLIENSLTPTHLATDFLPAAQEALRLLKRRQLPNKELYIFSDMQKRGWESQPSALTETLRDVSRQATIYLVRCGNRQLNNVAITGITPQSGIPRPGERVGFAVLVKNTGTKPATDLQVFLRLDGDDKTQETRSIKKLSAGETQAVTLTAKMTKKGLHVVTASVKEDDLEADNRFDSVIRVRDAVRVLVIDGAFNSDEPTLSSSYFLLNALQPVADPQKAKFPIQPTLTTPRGADPGMLKDYDLCILTDVSVKPDLKKRIPHLSPQFLDELNRYVRQGKGLVIFAGKNVSLDAYNRVFVKKHKLLPWQLAEWTDRKPDNPLYFNRNTTELSVYRRFKEDKVYEQFNNVMVWKSVRLNEPVRQTDKQKGNVKIRVKKPAGNDGKKKLDAVSSRATTVALRYDNGSPAIVSHRVDAGEVIFFTTAAHPGRKKDSLDPTWSILPVLPYWMPMVDLTLTHLLHRQTQNHNASAGAALTWFAPRKEASRSFALYQPDGKRRPLGMPTVQGDRPMLTMDNLSLAGVYRLVSVDPKQQGRDINNDPLKIADIKRGKAAFGRPFAVTPDLSESENLEAMTNEQIDDQLGFRVIHATAAAEPGSYSGLDRTNREWTWWVLLAVLMVCCFEGFFAWFCGRPI